MWDGVGAMHGTPNSATVKLASGSAGEQPQHVQDLSYVYLLYLHLYFIIYLCIINIYHLCYRHENNNNSNFILYIYNYKLYNIYNSGVTKFCFELISLSLL